MKLNAFVSPFHTLGISFHRLAFSPVAQIRGVAFVIYQRLCQKNTFCTNNNGCQQRHLLAVLLLGFANSRLEE